jgi:hypothetical protein
MTLRVHFLFVALLLVDAAVSRIITPSEDNNAASIANNLLYTKDKMSRNTLVHQENPEELGPYTEGDIIYSKKLGRNGLVNPISHWPNGEVPYIINGTFGKLLIFFV